jgi:molecular chaperone DnaK
MANDNRLLSQFNLDGIPPAPRGVPQIEVKFDIDANGILNVAARDLGTGKEHSVRVEQSSGLNEGEIDRMRKDAESHAEEDKKKRQLAEARNQADSLCFQLEKLMKENEGKLSASDKAPLESAITRTRETAKGSDLDAIKSAISDLEQASQAFTKTLYAAAGAPGAGPAGAADGAKSGGPGDEDVVDAEFEVKE